MSARALVCALVGWALAAPAQPVDAQESGFPSGPIFAASLAHQDARVAAPGVTDILLNPAGINSGPALALAYVAHPQTGLMGGAVIGRMRVGVPLALMTWTYRVDDLFDAELLAEDPALGLLEAYSVAAAVGTGVGFGRLRIGAAGALRQDNILGNKNSQTELVLGSTFQAGHLLMGLSASRHAGLDAPQRPTEVRAGISLSRLRVGALSASFHTAAARTGGGATPSGAASCVIGFRQIAAVAGRHWRPDRTALGFVATFGRVEVAFAREVGSSEGLVGLSGVSITVGRESTR